jgi:hypothetical protein
MLTLSIASMKYILYPIIYHMDAIDSIHDKYIHWYVLKLSDTLYHVNAIDEIYSIE